VRQIRRQVLTPAAVRRKVAKFFGGVHGLFDRGSLNVAREGVPFMLVAIVAAVAVARFYEPWFAIVPLAIVGLLFLLFRDPERQIPTVAMGVVSPVDGVVESVTETDRCVVQGKAFCIRFRIDPFGAYAARSPIEGRVMDLHSRTEGVGPDCPTNALWVRTDEGHSVVLQFHHYRFGIAPRSFARYGERLGQGERCAYIRLARAAELYLPANGRVRVAPGQRVHAGTDLVASVPHP